MSEHGLLADIILPLLPNQLFTYRVPEGMEQKAQTGMRAVVQFGRRKYYTGIVKKIHNTPVIGQSLKTITSFPDEKPLVNELQLKFWDWLADYYMCSTGEVCKAALPSGLKPESETEVFFNEEFNHTITGNPGINDLLEIIRNNPAISLPRLSRLTGRKNIMADIRFLEAMSAVSLSEKLKPESKARKEKVIFLSEKYSRDEMLLQAIDSLSKAPKQKELLHKFIELAGDDLYKVRIPINTLSGKSTRQAFLQLVQKGIFSLSDTGFLPAGSVPLNDSSPVPLTIEQSDVLDKIRSIFLEKEVCLLHGVTSSGKTEIYIHLISETLKKGRQVLYLLPEIALTTHITERLRRVFGDLTGVYHSRFPDSERVKVYNSVLSSGKHDYQIILGVRSSVFLPFSNLGLVIVDEEHENTYKQFDPAPRYHARDSAIMLAHIHKANVLMGTATPSMESWTNCKNGKYGMATLKKRYGEIKMPEIFIANIRESRRKNRMKSVFTPVLIKEMEAALKSGKQVILFQNRRGYSSFLECDNCNWIPRCLSCDVSLTYHRITENLICHYCGYTRKVPGLCSECHSSRIVTRGFGTELVEDDIELLFPEAKTARLDLDTSRSVKSYEKIFHDFANGKTNILVGTQMLSKGLDFEKVGLVGILNADQMLNYPDFRAYERSFQLMMQVSGRAGRRNEQGKVVIQTSDPGNPVIRYVRDNDFEGFFNDQHIERQTFNYPPFVRIIKISLRNKNPGKLREASFSLAEEIKAIFGKRVLGPMDPVIGRIQTYYIKDILLKIEKTASFDRARKLLQTVLTGFQETQGRQTKIQIDVDPA